MLAITTSPMCEKSATRAAVRRRRKRRRFGILTRMSSRELTPLDQIISRLDDTIRSIGAPPARAARPSPAAHLGEDTLTANEKTHAAGLMRVNHAGEVAAQGLYQGHATVARDPETREQMLDAAAEEMDHLRWCEERLQQLGEGPSLLGPVWYAGAFAIGAASGVIGDRWSLGFVEETERQVAEHLNGHLQTLPAGDARSRAIVEQMRAEEEEHGANAHAAGAARLPAPIRGLMKLTAKVMTRTAYRI